MDTAHNPVSFVKPVTGLQLASLARTACIALRRELAVPHTSTEGGELIGILVPSDTFADDLRIRPTAIGVPWFYSDTELYRSAVICQSGLTTVRPAELVRPEAVRARTVFEVELMRAYQDCLTADEFPNYTYY